MYLSIRLLGKSITLPSGEISVNDALYKMLGYSPEELQNKKWQDITYPDDIELTQQALDPIFSGKKDSARFIKRYIHKNGSVIWGDVGTSVRRDEEGKPLYFITFINDITERKLAEEALRQSEEQFRTLFMSMREGFYLSEIIYDDNGNPCDYRYLEVNPKFEEMIGLSREDIVGKRYKELVPVDTTQWLNNYFKVATTGKPGTYEFYSNEYNTYYETYSYMPAKGQVSVIVKDITDRKLAEEALRKSEELFRNLFQYHAAIKLIIDPDTGNILDANEAAVNYYGWPHEQITQMKIQDINMLPTEEVKAAMEKVRKQKKSHFEFRHRRADGSVRDVEIFSSSIKVQEKDILHTIVYDITDRKLAEEELRNYRDHLEELVKQRTNELDEGRNMLRTLIDSLPDEIYAKDSESRFIMANSHVLRTFGRTSFNDILGKTDFDFLPNEEAMKAYSKEHSVLQHDGQMINYEEQIMDTNGKMRWLAVTKVPMRDKEGRITGLVGINSDVTEFKRIEENLQKAKEAAETANRAKSTFLSSMSHEIRTPMNAILGFSELMLHDKNLTADQTNWIKTINQSGEHLLALINDILEISRIEAGRITYNPSSFDLYELLHDLRAMFKIKTDTKHLTLLFEYSDDLPRFVITDEGKLRQILINIIGNAVKFTQEGGIIIRIHSEPEKDGKISLTIETEDTGPGIAEKDMKVLFQMFGQTETGIKEGGTGLGLAISQQYAKIMGGYITVKSKPGKGTCFIIKIDVLPGNKLTEKNHINGRVVRLKSGESYKVLVVDDRENNRKLLKDMLLSVGFTVEEAKNGLEAIKKV